MSSLARIWIGAGMTAVLGWAATTTAAPSSSCDDAAPSMAVLDVPFVPQGRELCGGAALASVFRFWGEGAVFAEDFASLVEPEHHGIRTSVLLEAVVERGWTAIQFRGTKADVCAHLRTGRPIVALLRVGADRYHYVVVVAWTNDWVIVHDPSAGPFRAVREGDFLMQWAGSARWALLILPPARIAPRADEPSASPIGEPSEAPDVCRALIAEGVALAMGGESDRAEQEFLAAQELCPRSSAPLRERAGLRFRAGDWSGASDLAARAVAIDDQDAHAWRVLAVSRFLCDDVEGALAAWNQVSEPRNDLTRIDGLVRTRYSTVNEQIALTPGRLLTPDAFRRAQRRVTELPARTRSSLSLRPLPNGLVEIDAVVMERPLLGRGRWDLARAAATAFVDHEARIEVASPTRNGELWTATWRWWTQRPRVALSLAVPSVGVRPGVWRVEGSWERQAYAVTAGTAATMDEERRRDSLSYSDWLGPDLRLELGVALDRWEDRGHHVSVDGAVERRWSDDRWAIALEAGQWANLGGGVPFSAAGVRLHHGASGNEQGDAWRIDVGYAVVTTHAPLATWPGAGTGHGRAPLLRAHPLLDGGVVSGGVFGRSLAHATIEREFWPWRRGPARLGFALFVDGAKAWSTRTSQPEPVRVDPGVGLRLRSLGMHGQLRIDVARGLGDGDVAASIAWRGP